MLKGAKSQNARSSELRKVPKCAKSQNAADGGRCNLRSRRSERSAVQRPMGFRALWDFALYGTSRSMGPRALWDLALYGTSRSMGLFRTPHRTKVQCRCGDHRRSFREWIGTTAESSTSSTTTHHCADLSGTSSDPLDSAPTTSIRWSP